MGLRFIVGFEQGCEDSGRDKAVLWCSTSGIAFGRAFPSLEEGEKFVWWAEEKRGINLRKLTGPEVVGLQDEWLAAGRPGRPEPEDPPEEDEDVAPISGVAVH